MRNLVSERWIGFVHRRGGAQVVRILCFVVLALVVGGQQAAPVSAATISFDSLEQAGNNFVAVTSPYQEAGYQIQGSTLHYAQQSNHQYAGSAGLHLRTTFGLITLSSIGGELFSLASIDLSILSSRDGATSPPVTFQGYLASGVSIFQTFTPTTFGFQTFAFTGFENLLRVEWHQGCCEASAHQFDNIVASAVPAPAALPLFLAGLAGLGLVSWRKRAVQA